MARLRREEATRRAVSSDDSDFAPSMSVNKPAKLDLSTASGRRQLRTSPRKKSAKQHTADDDCSDVGSDVPVGFPTLVPKTTSKKTQLGRQIALKPLNASPFPRTLPLLRPLDIRRPRIQKPIPASEKAISVEPNEADASVKTVEEVESEDSVEVEESIWCGSNHESEDSEEELPSPRKLFAPRGPLVLSSKPGLHPPADVAPLPNARQPRPYVLDSDSDSRSAIKLSSDVNVHSRPGSSSDKENTAAILRFSPPRLYSPAKFSPHERPTTPPQSPTKSRLQSPSKPKARIPTPPLRQSLDAFWNADTVNDWNEQYSPKKLLKSPKKLHFIQDDSFQPPSSPRKPQSPSKRTKGERDAKKSFETAKHQLAESFLAELDQRITQGKISHLSASTGGVRLIWSKTLNSTAGRANWRKETTKSRQLDGTTTAVAKHFASIELAEKVIDDSHRLLNVLAHEFCHLANFMVSGIKDQPHGKQFKDWGRKCTQTFGDRGVEVTTKHSYQIEYKFVWQCANEMCGAEFKRHSKSIDPARKVCGGCKGRLVQIKPVPRKQEGGGDYAGFVKEHFAQVKRGMVGASQKEVMEAVARNYRAEKEAKSAGGAGGKTDEVLEKLASKVEVITLDDD
ncbi:uncharacterized protein LTR77_003198 [Saxophila tyrrhenica]|uniref:SprT-like domain-containing protein n=1 Tax=Saxophila tyrrhenica TaxID=1690608 RepID=A0AAV9PGQ4_9PEZI|nr:hypothetical protein LTR77_003198 [Saxophila tyrrhenica]